MAKFLFSSESVTEGHPDKVCDCVSDAILVNLIALDPMSRVACETFASTNCITVMGEITTNAKVDYEKIIRDTVCNIGYNSDDIFFNGNNCEVIVKLHEQSADIALGVDKSFEVKKGEEDELNLHGAGDQGMMFGYACDETPELMPLPISLAHKMAYQLTKIRKDGILNYLRPDGKTQVTVQYVDGVPKRIDTVVVSTQHTADVDLAVLREDIINLVVKPIIPAELLDDDTKYYINPTGRFVIGGPHGDTGLTGRKIIVDTYGGAARHGGGAFSGKDPTKVDRSAAYAARYVAKNIVAAKIAKKCEVQIAYAIGVANPVSVMVDTFGTGVVSDDIISKAIAKVFDLRPAAIIKNLQLRRPIYSATAAYGHLGRTDLDLPWEKTDKTDELLIAIK